MRWARSAQVWRRNWPEFLVRYFFVASRYGLSPFGEEPDELEADLANARTASNSE